MSGVAVEDQATARRGADSLSSASKWPRVRLGEILRRFNEIIHPGDRTSGEATFVGLEHIEPITGRRLGSSKVSFATMTGRKPTFRKGQIVYGYLRPYLNKVWVAEFDGCSSVDQFAFDVDQARASVTFLAAFLRSETFLSRAARATTPGQLPRISIEEIEAVELDLPPLAEQERVATRLAEQMAAVERTRAAARTRLAAAEALATAYLREVFEGPAAGAWEQCVLGDLVRAPIHTGISKPARSDAAKRCLTLSSVRGRILVVAANKPADVSNSEAQDNWVRPGCFYVVRGNGNRSLVGRGGFAPDPLPYPVLFPDLLFQVDLGDRVDPLFFWCLWMSRPVRDEIESRARTAAGIYKINTANLNSLPLRLPPITEQRRLAASLSRCLAGAERAVSGVREELAAVEALPAALLCEAFAGGVRDE